MVEYRKLRERFLRLRVRCDHPECRRSADEVHHSRGRAGDLLLDWRHWRAVCRRHHNWIGDHPAEARAFGLLCQPGLWNTPDKTPIPELR